MKMCFDEKYSKAIDFRLKINSTPFMHTAWK